MTKEKELKPQNALFIEINQEGFCTRVNQGVWDQTGFKSEEILGKRFKDFLVIEATRLHEIESNLANLGDAIYTFEAGFKLKAGNQKLLNWSMYWNDNIDSLVCIGTNPAESTQKHIRENRELRLLYDIMECLRLNNEPEEIFDGACKIVVKTGNYPISWISKINPHGIEPWYKESGEYIPQKAFVESGLLQFVFENKINDKEFKTCQIIQLDSHISQFWFKDNKPHIKSVIIFPLELEDKSKWMFSICSEFVDAFDGHEKDILQKISHQITEAIRNIQIQAKRTSTEESLYQIIRENDLLNEVNHQIFTQTEENELIKNVLETLVEKGGYKLAWMLLFEIGNEKQQVHIPQFIAGESPYAKGLSFDLNEETTLRGPTATCMLTRKTVVLNAAKNDTEYLNWLEKAKSNSLSSSIKLYLDIEGNEKGVVTLYSEKKDSFGLKEEKILQRIFRNLSLEINEMRFKSRLINSHNLSRPKTPQISNYRYLEAMVSQWGFSLIIMKPNSEVVYCSKDLLKENNPVFNTTLKIGERLINQLTEKRKIRFETALRKLSKESLVRYTTLFTNEIGEHTQAEITLLNVKLGDSEELILTTRNLETGNTQENEMLQQHQWLTEFHNITSFEISHEFHKLQSIVELVEDLKEVDPFLQEILSSSRLTFEKADVSIRKLAQKIGDNLQDVKLKMNQLKAVGRVLIIEEDELSAKISELFLMKFFEPRQIKIFKELEEVKAFYLKYEDLGDDLLLLDGQFHENGTSDFLRFYKSNHLKSPIVILTTNAHQKISDEFKRNDCVKNIVEKPLNMKLAEAIFSKSILSRTSQMK
ncbi:MAG: hypothetical protein SGJ00_01955 [bacterium]|nr:hypothetical protein [bacterium]